MIEATELDTRPARTDLTSRECCKILSSQIFGLYTLFGDEVVAAVLAYYVDAEIVWGVIDAMKSEFPNRLLLERAKQERGKFLGEDMSPKSACEFVLGGLVGGLSGMAKLEDVKTAVRWVHDHHAELVAGSISLLAEKFD
ncbi:MAG: hypothetical protein MUQ65_14145 [Armatimonadetes bacterium]|nr:hypothetical protein [Armatimonadota bacterium]